MIYTIKPGDTLSELAVRFGTTTETLVRMNAINNPDKIYAGDTLIVPGVIPEAVKKVLRFDPMAAIKRFFWGS